MENNLRAQATLLTAQINTLCNATSKEDIMNAFVAAKDLLIALYKTKAETL